VHLTRRSLVLVVDADNAHIFSRLQVRVVEGLCVCVGGGCLEAVVVQMQHRTRQQRQTAFQPQPLTSPTHPPPPPPHLHHHHQGQEVSRTAFCLMSPSARPPELGDTTKTGSLFTLFLTAPLMAFCVAAGNTDPSVQQLVDLQVGWGGAWGSGVAQGSEEILFAPGLICTL